MERAMLQRENKATTKSSSFFKPTIQKKLSIGSANDSYEVEADNMANKVMRMTEPSQQNVSQTGSLVQRKCTACEQEEKIQKKSLAENITPLIQRSSNSESGGQAPNHVESQINSSRGGGSSMDNGTKNFMESRFGTDFSDVKIHTGSQAVQMSRELNAQAFTVGNDIYFNEGKYSPNSDSGKHLLAHELTHTVQQTGGIGRKVQKQEDPCSYTTNNVKEREVHLNLGLNALRVYRRNGTSFSTVLEYENLITGSSTRALARANDWCHLYSVKGHQRLSGHGLINFVNYCGGFGFHSNYWRNGTPRPKTPTLIPGEQSAGCARIPDENATSTSSSRSNEFYDLVQDGDCVRIYSRSEWRNPTFSNCHGSDDCSP